MNLNLLELESSIISILDFYGTDKPRSNRPTSNGILLIIDGPFNLFSFVGNNRIQPITGKKKFSIG